MLPLVPVQAGFRFSCFWQHYLNFDTSPSFLRRIFGAIGTGILTIDKNNPRPRQKFSHKIGWVEVLNEQMKLTHEASETGFFYEKTRCELSETGFLTLIFA